MYQYSCSVALPWFLPDPGTPTQAECQVEVAGAMITSELEMLRSPQSTTPAAPSAALTPMVCIRSSWKQRAVKPGLHWSDPSGPTSTFQKPSGSLLCSSSTSRVGPLGTEPLSGFSGPPFRRCLPSDQGSKAGPCLLPQDLLGQSQGSSDAPGQNCAPRPPPHHLDQGLLLKSSSNLPRTGSCLLTRHRPPLTWDRNFPELWCVRRT